MQGARSCSYSFEINYVCPAAAIFLNIIMSIEHVFEHVGFSKLQSEPARACKDSTDQTENEQVAGQLFSQKSYH